MRVLIVDDDPDFRTFATIAMGEAGIEYECASSAEEALETTAARGEGCFDLILLDVNMPGHSGWDVLLRLREGGDDVPVIFVTAYQCVEDRVKGLRMGADDYLVKPVEFEELIARMQAVVRRRHSLAPIDYGDMRLDLARRRVFRNGKQIHLSPREYDLLLALVRADGTVLSRAKLLVEVWDMNFDPGTNVLEVHVGRLRKKLEAVGSPLIETVRGAGYRLSRGGADSERGPRPAGRGRGSEAGGGSSESGQAEG